MKNKNLIIWLLIASAIPAVCQTSTVKRYDNILGEKAIIRTNKKNYTYVTCSHTSDDRSCFIVKNLRRSEITKAFYTTQHVTPVPPSISNIGYWVSDLVVTQTECWFCGTKWEETGNFIQLENSPYWVPETIFCSYVGWFNLFDALDSGGGNFHVIELNTGDYRPKKMVFDGSNVTAISDNHVLEIYNIQNNSCSYRIGQTSWCGETFMDIVLSGDTVVTVSRFSDSTCYFYNHDFFAIRYGPTAPNNFVENNAMYAYDTYWLVNGDTWARFHQMEPVRLTAMCNKKDVVVSYLATDVAAYDPIPGHLIMFHIPDINNRPSEIITNSDTCTYQMLKDESRSVCYGNRMSMAYLLEDSTYRQVLRYPIPGRGYGTFQDTIKRRTTPRMDAIAMGRGYENEGNKYRLMASGIFLSDSKVAEVRDLSIREDSKGGFPERNCFNIVSGSFHHQQSATSLWKSLNSPLSINVSASRPVYNKPYSSFDVNMTTVCVSGFNPILSTEMPDTSE